MGSGSFDDVAGGWTLLRDDGTSARGEGADLEDQSGRGPAAIAIILDGDAL